MRFTTVIDISELKSLYRNKNVRLVYFHLAIRAGYHDNDRDIVPTSLRQLSADVGLTLSATRHAVAQLERFQLITRQGSLILVRKWLPEQKITLRSNQTKLKSQVDEAARRLAENEQRERHIAAEAQKREQLAAQGKTSFMIYYEDLQRKAEAGDIEAAALVKQHSKTYEQHKLNIKSKK